jgi:hypothetical protein
MDFEEDIDRVHGWLDAEDYATAELLIRRLRDEGCSRCELALFEAVCLYERKDDIGCLRLLVEFLRQAPGHPKRSYATFTAAVCLANLGLEKRALTLLRSLPVSYPDRDAELKEMRAVLAKRKEATMCAEEIQSLIGGE